VAEHVELGYASTAHRAQGATVDTAHTMISPTTTREVFYVAATRGRWLNRLYVDTAFDPDSDTSHGQPEPTSARAVLACVLDNVGAERSAMVTIQSAKDDAESMATLHAEYQSIAKVAQAERWDTLIAGDSGSRRGSDTADAGHRPPIGRGRRPSTGAPGPCGGVGLRGGTRTTAGFWGADRRDNPGSARGE
jgi:hypothetical protein